MDMKPQILNRDEFPHLTRKPTTLAEIGGLVVSPARWDVLKSELAIETLLEAPSMAALDTLCEIALDEGVTEILVGCPDGRVLLIDTQGAPYPRYAAWIGVAPTL